MRGCSTRPAADRGPLHPSGPGIATHRATHARALHGFNAQASSAFAINCLRGRMDYEYSPPRAARDTPPPPIRPAAPCHTRTARDHPHRAAGIATHRAKHTRTLHGFNAPHGSRSHDHRRKSPRYPADTIRPAAPGHTRTAQDHPHRAAGIPGHRPQTQAQTTS